MKPLFPLEPQILLETSESWLEPRSGEPAEFCEDIEICEGKVGVESSEKVVRSLAIELDDTDDVVEANGGRTVDWALAARRIDCNWAWKSLNIGVCCWTALFGFISKF